MNPALFRMAWRLKHLKDEGVLGPIRAADYNQHLSADELAAIAWEKQRKIVAHAYENCPYYRIKYENAGFQPGDLKTPDDFSRLPILTKEEVREHLDDMVAHGVAPSLLNKRFTGGSTGIPLMVYHDARTATLVWSIYLRTVRRWGIQMGDKTAHIWGLNRLNQEYLQTTQPWWRRALINYVLLDAFDLTEAKMQQFKNLLRGFKPSLLIGYTSAVTTFARYLKENGGAGFSPRAIWLTSEPTHDFQREVIEQTFAAPVYDQYGSVEVHHYAAECSHREGLHIEADYRTVEIVNEDGYLLPHGETGPVVVTDLINYAAPLIRYRNEDMASLLDKSCSCGIQLPLMSKVTGRIYDVFVLPDGTQVYGHRFTTFFYDHIRDVQSFQVHQTAVDQVVVRVVPTAACDRAALEAQALNAFHGYTKGQVKFDVKFVDSIPKEASGKYRFAKSDLAINHK